MPMKLLAVAGDPGGARVVMVVLNYLFDRQIPFVVVDHRYLSWEAPCDWPRINLPSVNENAWQIMKAKDLEFSGLLFASSVADNIPLSLARNASSFGVPVLHLLDHWGNYAKRLETDGEQRFLPDIYAVMDKQAFLGAISEGIPERILRITGHPGLSTLVSDSVKVQNASRGRWLKEFGFSREKLLIAFVSEPIDQDQISGHLRDLNWRFTQQTVLELVCRFFQPYFKEVQIGIVPHPREDSQSLNAVWESNHGLLEGGLLSLPNGRPAICLADGVVGIQSILLHEAWLIGRPVLSIQLGEPASNPLNILKRENVYGITDYERAPQTIGLFLNQVRNERGTVSFRPELKLHRDAPEKVYSFIREMME